MRTSCLLIFGNWLALKFKVLANIDFQKKVTLIVEDL